MPTDADFLRAIVADPDADAPRLAYADWLDECGDAARAEFIRVQCALAALPEADREFHPLAGRQDELVKAHYVDWLQPLDELLDPAAGERSRRWRWLGGRRRPNIINYDFRRGLVECLHLDVEVFLRAANRLTRMTPLRVLTLDPAPGPEQPAVWESLITCPELAGLTGLHMPVHLLTPDEMRRFTDCPHLLNLQTLGLSSHGFRRGAVDVLTRSPLLARLRQLHVVLESEIVGQPCADQFLCEPACRNLEALTVIGMPDAHGVLLRQMVASQPFDRLTSLALSGSEVGDEPLDHVVEWLPPMLVDLRLSALGLGDRSAASLAWTPRVRGLRTLDLSANQITDVGAMTLADSPNLFASTRLDLTGNPISRRVQNALRVRMGHHVTV